MRFLMSVAGAAALAACATMSFSDSDPFRWLEGVEDPKALAWVRAENDRSLKQLEADARFQPMQADALKVLTNKDRLPLGAIRGNYVFNFWQDETNVRGLWRRAPLASYASGAPQWEPLLDLDALAAKEGANWVWKGSECQPGGVARCLVSLSDGGKDAKTMREFDLATRQFVAGGFTLPEAKSSVSWKDANALYVATDWGPGTLTTSGYPFVVKELVRGRPLAEAREVLRGAASDVGMSVADFETAEGDHYVIAVRSLTFFTAEIYLLTKDGPKKLPLPLKATPYGAHKGELIFTIEGEWTPPGAAKAFPTGSLLSLTLDHMDDAKLPIRLIYGPGPRETVGDIALTRDAVLVAGYSNVRGRILRYAYDGRDWIESQISLGSNGSVGFAGASPLTSTAFAVTEDYLLPDTLVALDARIGSAKKIRTLPAQFDAARLQSTQFEATSKDGTKIPYTLVRRKDALSDGSTPTLLYGYGGFQVPMFPSYSPVQGKLWLERGGAFVMANIRGGGEFGPAWHQAGLKQKRQVIYDDFIAVAEDLIARKVTSPRRLGIMGGSNGGLLMGVMLTQRPDLFHAAVVQVPLLDMLRYHELPAGASWIDEYGDPRIEEERAFLAKISPYQNWNPGKTGEVVPFFVTSTKDDRVHPGHARKMAAKLQAAKSAFLYYENIDGGHGADANQNEAARRRALEYVYLSERLMD
jgi:prolyl oligopeptidase